MKTITIHRKWQLANAWMPHWVVAGISRADFMKKFHLPDARSCEIDALGYVVKRMEFDPNDYGVPVANGKTLVIEADDNTASAFAVTFDGLLSNELLLPPFASGIQHQADHQGRLAPALLPRAGMDGITAKIAPKNVRKMRLDPAKPGLLRL